MTWLSLRHATRHIDNLQRQNEDLQSKVDAMEEVLEFIGKSAGIPVGDVPALINWVESVTTNKGNSKCKIK